MGKAVIDHHIYLINNAMPISGYVIYALCMITSIPVNKRMIMFIFLAHINYSLVCLFTTGNIYWGNLFYILLTINVYIVKQIMEDCT